MWGKDWVSGGRGKFSQNVMYEERVTIIKKLLAVLFVHLSQLSRTMPGR